MTFLPVFQRAATAFPATLPEDIIAECAAVVPASSSRLAQAKAHLDSLTKPVGSLGRLEELAMQLFAAQEKTPLEARPARMFTMAADHGVVAEGVASSPQEVTVLMVRNFLEGGAAINSFCASAGMELRIVDVGVAADPFAPHPMLVTAKVARGTANMAHGPAMTLAQCADALRIGVAQAEEARKDGVRVVGTGEMGIGNTTASSALFCAYFGFSATEMTGIGAGIPQAGLAHKSRIIEQALTANARAIASGDAFAVLAALGGLEIAALAGLIIGGSARRMMIAIDGFIATAAYAAASHIVPAVEDYCFFTHGSAEAGHAAALRKIGKTPLLDLGLRLGEGTGAALGIMLLEASARVYNSMSTFAGAGIKL